MTTFIWAAATHQGRVRSINEDSCYPTTAGSSVEPVVMVVADGMGGAVAGEVASRLAVESAIGSEGDVADRLRAANRAILDEVARNPSLAGMGTTTTLIEFDPGGSALYAHVGDSRAYLLRDGDLTQLTVDHTVVNEYVQTGKLTAAEAATHPQRSMLTRALGLISDIEIDTGRFEVLRHDRLLICSDGVNSMIGDGEIAEALRLESAEEAAWDLVERANRAGGHDNITALVIDIVGDGESG